jgi:hypothetical protein
MTEYEGEEEEGGEHHDSDTNSINEAIEALILDDTGDIQDQSEQFITSFGTLQPNEASNIATTLANQATAHALCADLTPTPNMQHDQEEPFAYIATERYNSTTFYGVMIDTGASKRSTAGYGQYMAYKKLNSTSSLDTTRAGAINVQFGIGSTASIGSITVHTPIGNAEFHVVHADTPFLLCLADLDSLGVYYNNIQNLLIGPSGSAPVPVVRRFGHPFMLWNQALHAYINDSIQSQGISCYLTAPELRQLHRRFGHPSANRLYSLLERSGHAEDVDKRLLQRLTRLCEHCQKHGKSPGRFKFTLRDKDIDFNHSIFVDIMYIDHQPVLHIIDEATRYQAARFMKDMTAKHTWDLLRLCWIDTYVGPPDQITHDAGKNFISKEFRQYAKGMAISTKSVPVEAHWSVGLIERAHPILRRAYEVIFDDLQVSNTKLSRDMVLQMAVKAVNDTAGPQGLIPTLLVYGTYPRMIDSDLPAPSVQERAEAIRKAMNEVAKLRAQTQVKEALNQRNGPDTSAIHDTPINSKVLVWREGNTGQSGYWDGPFRLIGINNESCRVQLPHGPTDFRSTVVKPFLEELQDQDQDTPNEPNTENRVTTREQAATDEAVRLLNQSIQKPANQPDITAFLGDFTTSRQKELNGLLENGVFEMVSITDIPQGVRIFNSRFVDEIKNKGTDKAFEKSRLVVQAYKDQEKDMVLTQSPTIQRVSQRLLLALAPTLANLGVSIYLRDITQAYTQSKTTLNRQFYVRPPAELELPEGSILRVVKPLYGVPEAGNHWFNTYHTHHIRQLHMNQSTYDPCLLYANSTTQGGGFGLVGLQTDDTLILGDSAFVIQEDAELKRAQFLSKEREQLTKSHPLKFNGGHITLEREGSIVLTQERQCGNLQLVQLKATDLVGIRGGIRKGVSTRDQYVAQRARGAYIATVSQPEAAFDLSFAAQTIKPEEDDIKQLNKRIQWQIDNSKRGLRYVRLDQQSMKLIVFTDASFANNTDYTSQIGFIICLTDDQNRANILHWSSIKCKRVTRSVLASELYAMAHGFDIGAAIKSTIEAILRIPLPLVMCTDSKSLFECLVKLGTTAEKRLMVDIMCLRQSYERREIAEIKWINGNENPADAMTKSKACPALKALIDSNIINITANKWVERVEKEHEG